MVVNQNPGTKVDSGKYRPFDIKAETRELEGNDVYFSGAVSAESENPELGYEIVTHMLRNGANVLDPHVGAMDATTRSEVFTATSGHEVHTPAVFRKVDMDWLDSANKLVAVVDNPSHGVGMEVMRTALRRERGMRPADMLILIERANFPNMSPLFVPMAAYFSGFNLAIYESQSDALESVNRFLKSDGTAVVYRDMHRKAEMNRFLEKVKKSDHITVDISNPDHFIGAYIEVVLLQEEIGNSKTFVTCKVREAKLPFLSRMITGAADLYPDKIEIVSY